MANISIIKVESSWGEEAPRINQNFSNINTDIQKLKNTTSVILVWADTVEKLKNFVTKPYNGQFALVGESLPAPIYRYNGSQWEDTGETGGINSDITLSNYYSKQEIDNLLSQSNEAIQGVKDSLELISSRVEKIEKRDIFMSLEEFEQIVDKDEEKIYYIYEEE